MDTVYNSWLDTGFAWTSAFRLSGGDVADLRNVALFVLMLIVPAA